MAETPVDPLEVIERAIWRHGVQGDACALLAASILSDLDAGGWVLVPPAGNGS